MIKERGYRTIKEGLLFKDKNIVLKSLAELSLKLYDDKVEIDDKTNLSLLLNRLIFEENFFTEVVLNYLAVWLQNEKINLYFDNFKDLILLILEKFKSEIPRDCNKPFVLSQLINVADYYMAKYEANEITTSYNELKKNGDYQYSLI
ncbi:hypothetical protein [Flavobacterium gawalongense]|uniref:Uncharacterized protein n=1 Tax=Flavobacterium gawalongense TaxID=2594432 RepID=A0A553BKC8_9FLAO|nr:hypothetical protein [Flavobacterium gawalongense]TRX03995.1 hypothetical protein FNW33_02725 [Flavobacterium gawalongense]TRX07173.1 hypothetical protein FNW12_07135 [Flavobacterium gawalongense]TRX08704.1 hypothetical protein FNW11_10805 [Flavobacterium gawalongense]TRX09459.1 hypothetical protein FNW10_11320 [Flavobacterium gawalongense]TRX25430.1 hypothetical protein FNW38_11295 [Flavobacterium gawalongense]